MKIRFLEPARDELEDAIHFYDREQQGLAIIFRNETLRALSRISAFPLAHPKFSKNSRRCLMRKFPYGIIYQYDPDNEVILVLAVAHLHREPSFWTSR